MKPHERHARILQLLRQHGTVAVTDLSQALDVSKMTVRRDLEELQEIGLVVRQYGGARLMPDQGETEWPLELRKRDHANEKRAIGKMAASLLGDGDVVIIDGGSTALEVVRNLVQTHLTVITNSYPVLQALSNQPAVNLVATGGQYQPNNQTFIGPLAVETLSSINANVAILGTTCFSLSKGLTIRSFEEAAVQKAKIAAADRIILVMDSGKMHTHTLTTVAPVDAIDVLVTDEGLSDQDRQAIEAHGVVVLVAAAI